jgi:hypothetical protein
MASSLFTWEIAMLKSWFCALILMAASLSARADGAAPEPELPVTDVHAVRATVEAQLQALAADDAALAFSYAVPAIQSQFQDPATFAAMVRQSYPMLIRPKSISFYQPELRQGIVMQAVRFREGDGRYWRAVSQLQRQPDKRWRIGGCVVAADDDASTT